MATIVIGGEELDDAFQESVKKSFIKDGKIDMMPSQRKKQYVILFELAKLFETGKQYKEIEVNRILKPVYEDFCTVRRDLVDLGLMKRDNGIYEKV